MEDITLTPWCDVESAGTDHAMYILVVLSCRVAYNLFSLLFILRFINVLWRLYSTAIWHALHERSRASSQKVAFALDNADFGSFASVDIVTSAWLEFIKVARRLQ